ncbi:MAG: iron chelate uptake ABC transporter family permease subunit [Sulfurospirillaceae bacterium]|nr:iron chelate uptake ABC transporter family permease subunit [Sulfurospirillaceae bacterium]
MVIVFASLISALSVSLGGMIGWIGLIIPHIARFLVGPNNRFLLPICALIGAIFLIVVDDIARLLFSVELPIGIITSLIGIPLFIMALNKAKRGIQ